MRPTLFKFDPSPSTLSERPRRWYSRWYTWLILAPLALLLVSMAAEVVEYERRPPAELLIYGPRNGWDRITVEAYELHPSVCHSYSDAPVRVSPIQHGVYLVGIRFRDGKTAWANLYHEDAGLRRHVELYIVRSSSQVKFRHIAYDNEVLYEGTTRIDKTSHDHPLNMGGF